MLRFQEAKPGLTPSSRLTVRFHADLSSEAHGTSDPYWVNLIPFEDLPMDIALLTAFITPFLPFLTRLGEKASEKAAEKFGEDAWNQAKALWAKLQPKVEANEDVKWAAERVAAKPDSDARKSVFQEELATLFDDNPDLAKEIAQIMAEHVPHDTVGTRIVQNVTGNRNQVIGAVSGGQIFGNITGTVVMGGSGSPSAAAPTPAVTAEDLRPPVKTILVLAANPKGTNPLRLSEEARNIQTGLERSRYRDRFRTEQRWAVTPTDIRRALLDCRPQIVHFSGHGVGVEIPGHEAPSSRNLSLAAGPEMEPEGLMFEDETGQPALVSGEALADLFALFADQLECVVLNACYSEAQANAIARHIHFVVGMRRAIGDKAAIEFAIGFYDALLSGNSVEFAYQLGCNALQLVGIPEHLTPVLKRRAE